MHTIRCSGRLSCHACSAPAMHAPSHAHPLHASPTHAPPMHTSPMHSHVPTCTPPCIPHTCPPVMHAPAVDRMYDRHVGKHYLSATSFADGKNGSRNHPRNRNSKSRIWLDCETKANSPSLSLHVDTVTVNRLRFSVTGTWGPSCVNCATTARWAPRSRACSPSSPLLSSNIGNCLQMIVYKYS